MLRLFSIFSIFFVCGCAHRPVAEAPVPSAFPIILYHHVDDLPHGASSTRRRWTISPEVFEEQMAWIAAAGLHPVTVRQWLEGAADERAIILTFDDGWKDNFTVVLPILKKYGFFATFFIITGSVGSSDYMTWSQIEEMAKAGMDIQSHTVHHRRLSTMKTAAARKEIAESKAILEEHLRQPVEVLAYPFGSYDDEIIELARSAGYKAAVTVSGLNGGYLWKSDRTFTLNRYAIERGERLQGILRVEGKSKEP